MPTTQTNLPSWVTSAELDADAHTLELKIDESVCIHGSSFKSKLFKNNTITFCTSMSPTMTFVVPVGQATHTAALIARFVDQVSMIEESQRFAIKTSNVSFYSSVYSFPTRYLDRYYYTPHGCCCSCGISCCFEFWRIYL